LQIIQLANTNLENLVLKSKWNGYYETFGKLNFKSKENELTLKCDYEKEGGLKLFISIFCDLKSIECEFS
jgi:hypothetical protein